ncbi:MAG: DUF433 domain-containing protein [Acidimicrobiaceae bacterium]|nr:DUF433 domain-containing protein [Acidimicrobiaceae bacterium]
MTAAAQRDGIPGGQRYLGRGIYDLAEVARLLRRGRGQIEGWTRSSRNLPPLLIGRHGEFLSFWDLISLRVVAELIARNVPRSQIAIGAQHLAARLGTDRPFAHEHLATVGSGFFAAFEGAWEDAGLGGQQAFSHMVEPLLKPIVFNDDHMAAVWRPAEGVWVNPAVQAGAPCVDGTRVPTRLVASLARTPDGEGSGHLADVCDDYRLTSEQVQQAVDYEQQLAA